VYKVIGLTFIISFHFVGSGTVHTHPMEGQQNSKGGGGSQKPKFSKGSRKLNWNFWRGGGKQSSNQKTFFGRIFWNTKFSFL